MQIYGRFRLCYWFTVHVVFSGLLTLSIAKSIVVAPSGSQINNEKLRKQGQKLSIRTKVRVVIKSEGLKVLKSQNFSIT